ncbi:MAG TPA: POTRA domain-containing protein, partial [Bryobacteraceae bacterium]|nr:POTRA domain-containing protein [Bryobacteraceae bacterium]
MALLLVAAARPREARADDSSFENIRIANLVFEPPEQPLEATVLANIVPLKRGEPYHAADVRATIERLYATGRYRDIQVDASGSAAEGITVRVITKGSWFIGPVTARADFSEPPSANEIVTVARLRLGEPFDESQIPVSIANIRKLLVDNGYFNASIDPEYHYDPTSQQVRIRFNITTGKRARYAEPQITGDTTVLSKEEIIRASRWRRLLLPGYSGITASRTRTGLDRIRLRFLKADRVVATVVLDGIDPDEEGKTGRPRLTVDPGMPLEVRTPGARIPTGQLRQSIPIFEEHAVDADLLAEGTDGLRDYFQSRGYYDAKVSDPVQHVENGVTVIEYTIDRGDLHRVVALSVTGNRYFDDKTIRERMVIAPRSFELRRGRYNEGFRKQDVAAIEALYQSNGFRDVKVTTRVVDDYLGRTGDIAVFFTIEEGDQYTVSSLAIRGPSKLDISKSLARLSSQVGQPFSEFSVAADRQTILEEYGEHGFPRATFEWSSKAGPKPHTIDLEFTISEGDQEFVREVVLSGLQSTSQKLVNKQITLNPGDPLSPVEMAETQKRLDDLGIFSQVDMAIQNPDGEEDHKYVLYDIQEAHKYSLTVAPGAEFARIGGSNAVTDLSNPGGGPGVSPRMTVNLTRLNFLGRGQTVSVQGILSTLQKRALVNYYVPKIFNMPKLDATFSVLYDDTHDVRTFRSIRKEASAQIVHHFSRPLTLFYKFSYRHVGVGDL